MTGPEPAPVLDSTWHHSTHGTLAILSPSVEDGGTEQYMRMLTSAAVSRGWRVAIAFPQRDSTSRLRAELAATGADVEAIELGNYGMGGKLGVARQICRNCRETLRFLRRHGATTAMVVLPHPDLAPGALLGVAMSRIPSAASVHLVRDSVHVSSLRIRLYDLTRRLGVRWIAVSENNRKVLAELFAWAAEDIDVIYYGIEDKAWPDSARAQARAEIRNELDLPASARLALTVARLSPQKGHEVIIETIPKVLQAFDDVWWVWAGDGSRRSELNEMVAKTGCPDRVRFLGNRTDVPRLLAASDLFVFPTHFEGLGMALVEAHLSKVPVIASSVGPIPEVVRDKQEGLLVAPGDVSDLAERTIWALRNTDAVTVMATTARTRMLRMFSVERMVQETFHRLDSRNP